MATAVAAVAEESYYLPDDVENGGGDNESHADVLYHGRLFGLRWVYNKEAIWKNAKETPHATAVV